MSVKEYCSKVEEEPQEICDSVLSLLDGKPIGKTSACEPEVSYQKMKVDSYRYIAEFTDGDAKSRAVENARVVYAEAVAEKDLPVILLIYLDLVLNCFAAKSSLSERNTTVSPCRFGTRTCGTATSNV